MHPARANTSRASAATSRLVVSGERYTLAEGDVVTFRGDQRHGYHNPGTAVAIAYSVIAFAPVTS